MTRMQAVKTPTERAATPAKGQKVDPNSVKSSEQTHMILMLQTARRFRLAERGVFLRTSSSSSPVCEHHPFKIIQDLLSRGKVPTDKLFRHAVNNRRRPPSEIVPACTSWDNAILSLFTSCQLVNPEFGRTLMDDTFYCLVFRSREVCRQQKSPARALMWYQERRKHNVDHNEFLSPAAVKMYNTLIDICAKTEALSVAESLYGEMTRNGGANLYSVTSLVEAQSRGGRSLETIRDSLSAYYIAGAGADTANGTNWEKDPITTFAENGGAPAAVLIDALGRCNATSEMLEAAFGAIPKGIRNRNHHLSLIEAHARCGRISAALDAITVMGASGISRRGYRKASVYATVLSLAPCTESTEAKLRRVAEELGDEWWFRESRSNSQSK